MNGTNNGQGGGYDRPPYAANWIPDASQSSKELLDRHGRNAANPAAHEVYRRHVEAKERDFGVIHIDPATGYRARFKPQAAAGGQGTGGQGAGNQGTGGRTSGGRGAGNRGAGNQGAGNQGAGNQGTDNQGAGDGDGDDRRGDSRD